MLSVALKGLAQRKLRAVLTGLAVIIGVAMITGTYVLTDTISNAFGSIYQQSYKGADAVVTPKTIVHADNAGTPTITASELQRISARPDVAAASGQVADDTGARLTNRAGKPIDTKGAPSLAFGLDADQPQFSLMSVDEGRLARGPNEVVIDEGTASENGFHVGDSHRHSDRRGHPPVHDLRDRLLRRQRRSAARPSRRSTSPPRRSSSAVATPSTRSPSRPHPA